MTPATLDQVAESILYEAARHVRPQPVVYGHELPVDLAAVGVPQVTVTIPAAWRWQGGLVEEEHLPEIAAALENRLHARVATNRMYAGAIQRPLAIRRAARGERAWAAAHPVIAVGDRPGASPAPAALATVRVRIGQTTYTLGPRHTRELVDLGEGSLVLALDGEFVVFPEKLAVAIEGAVHRTAVVVEGPFRVHEPGWWRWGTPGRVLAEGEVLDRVGSRPAPAVGCRVWSDGIELALDAETRSTTVSHGDAGVELRLDPGQGVLALRAVGSGPVTGRSALGRLLFDALVEIEVLPGELEQISVGGKLVSLAMMGPRASRERRTVTVGPERSRGSAIFSDNLLVTDPTASSVRHVGEIYVRDGVRSLFRALRRCRVDGRAAEVGDVVPVHADFSLQLGGSPLLVHT